jgi:putative isomerase
MFGLPENSMNLCRLALIAAGLGLALGAAPARDGSARPSAWTEFPDVLELRQAPRRADEEAPGCLFDCGAWHGYAAPAGPTEPAGFAGPYLTEPGRWLSAGLARFNAVDAADGTPLVAAPGATAATTVYPGLLRHDVAAPRAAVRLELYFASASVALVRAVVTNRTAAPRAAAWRWEGGLLDETARLEAGVAGIRAVWGDGAGALHLVLPAATPWRVRTDGPAGYRADSTAPVVIPPGGTAATAIALVLVRRPSDGDSERRQAAAAVADPDAAFTRNRQRWQGYLDRALGGNAPLLRRADCRRLAVKAVMTLMGNWRAPAGALRHDGLIPSGAVGYFNGFWAWDSWKHAVALAEFAPELARSQVRAMLERQDDAGMVPDCVFADSAQDNWLNSKPPLAAWAVDAVYAATGDREFVRAAYPRLLRYHRWWHARRDRDGDGLCEYGATRDDLTAAKWESGMDNAARFDAARLRPNGPGAWTLDQASADLNAYLYAEKRCLARLARLAERPGDAVRLDREAGRLRDAIRRRMFQTKNGVFADIRLDDGAFVAAPGPEAWIPLWAGAAARGQAARVRDALMDPTRFRTRLPFPTLSAAHPAVTEDGYWRGPVWLDQAHFGLAGLRRYGFHREADALTEQLLASLEGALAAGPPLRENYDPHSGRGLRAPNFSWTAAHLLLILRDRPALP